MTEKILGVEGMGCGHCQSAVEGGPNSLSGVESSNADFRRGTVEVVYDEDRLDIEDFRVAVEEASYTLAV